MYDSFEAFLAKGDGKTRFETTEVCKKAVHKKAAQMKKEMIRKVNKKRNATSTSKVVHTGIKQLQNYRKAMRMKK